MLTFLKIIFLQVTLQNNFSVHISFIPFVILLYQENKHWLWKGQIFVKIIFWLEKIRYILWKVIWNVYANGSILHTICNDLCNKEFVSALIRQVRTPLLCNIIIFLSKWSKVPKLVWKSNMKLLVWNIKEFWYIHRIEVRLFSLQETPIHPYSHNDFENWNVYPFNSDAKPHFNDSGSWKSISF